MLILAPQRRSNVSHLWQKLNGDHLNINNLPTDTITPEHNDELTSEHDLIPDDTCKNPFRLKAPRYIEPNLLFADQPLRWYQITTSEYAGILAWKIKNDSVSLTPRTHREMYASLKLFGHNFNGLFP